MRSIACSRLVAASTAISRASLALGIDVVPAVRFHELQPAAEPAALGALAEYVGGLAGDGGVEDAGLERHLVVVGIAASDHALARVRGVVPVLHVVLLGHADR